MATTVPGLAPDASSGLAQAVQLARGLFGAAACSVAVVDLDTGTLRYVASHGQGEREIVGVTVPVDRGVAGWVARSGSTVVVADAAADPRFARDVAESTGYVPGTILAAPVPGLDEPAAVLSVLDPTRRERELDLLAAIGELLAPVVSAATPDAGASPALLAAAAAVPADRQSLAAALLTTLARHAGTDGTAR